MNTFVDRFLTVSLIVGSYFLQDGRNKAILTEAVNRRNRNLRRLREWDYNKFCWVLEKLNLEYTPIGMKRRTTRMEIYKTLIQKQAMEIRKEKFVKYHAQLKGKQEKFLQRKEKDLADIEAEEKEILVALEKLDLDEKQHRAANSLL